MSKFPGIDVVLAEFGIPFTECGMKAVDLSSSLCFFKGYQFGFSTKILSVFSYRLRDYRLTEGSFCT
ncbi:MAG: hypothetical protein OXD49_17960 [Candidatus Poribacteria bacterium]|nr:hypothetical protein [Candidatus Poribacteria bacterium]